MSSPVEPTAEVTTPSSADPQRSRAMVIGGLLVAVGLVIGAGVTYAAEHHSSSHDQHRPFGYGQGNRPFGGPNQLPGGVIGGAPPIGGRPVIRNLVRGTVAATTSTTISVKTSTATTQYAVTSATQVVRDGQQASLSDVKVNDPVIVQIGPSVSSASKPTAIRVIAGTSAGGFGPGAPVGPGG